MIKKFNYVENDTHIFLLILYLILGMCMQENDVRVCSSVYVFLCANVANSIALLNVYCFLFVELNLVFYLAMHLPFLKI